MIQPTPTGVAAASTIQTARTSEAGVCSGMGSRARTSAACLGNTTPITRKGHAAAAPTAIESKVRSDGGTSPKRASVAQPKIARTTLPSERRNSPIRPSIHSMRYELCKNPARNQAAAAAGSPRVFVPDQAREAALVEQQRPGEARTSASAGIGSASRRPLS